MTYTVRNIKIFFFLCVCIFKAHSNYYLTSFILIIFLFLANNIFSMDHGQIISDYLSNKITSQKLNEKILDNKWNFLAIVKYVPFQEVRKIYLKLYKEYSPEFRRLNSDAYICQEISSAYEELIKYKKNSNN